jgi:oligopeptide/dipeptide ABC transporter ATP-binding protein
VKSLQSNSIILDVHNLKVNYKLSGSIIRAVGSVNFSLKKGDRLAIVGESGSGKSTLGLSIIRLCPAEISGEIFLEDIDLLKLKEEEFRKMRGSDISIVFQDPGSALNPVMRVGEQVMEVFTSHGFSKSDAYNRSVSLLKMVEIPEPERRMLYYPHQLSGGMKQRVVIAMAIALNPRLLIADEPTSALDVTIQDQILKLIRNLSESKGLSMILITHDMGVAAEVCNFIGIMYAGRILEMGTLKDIFENPKHPYTLSLMSCIPKGQKGVLKPLPGNVPDMSNLPDGCKFHPRCPYVDENCRLNEPELLSLDGRLIACHRVK